MNVEHLIHAIVRQTTVLIAQLATAHGIRAPLAHIADQVFADLVDELERQGVSRKVSADMFGLGLRTYRRKVQRLGESSTVRGRSLWETVFEYIKNNGEVSRSDILLRFSADDVAQLKAVLHDLCESQLIQASTTKSTTIYRESTPEEATALNADIQENMGDELLVALMYREGPQTLQEITVMIQGKVDEVDATISRLLKDGRVQRLSGEGEPRYRAQTLLIPLGAPKGWEVAVFDHFKALVATVQARLRENQPSDLQDKLGGSTYTFSVWPGHPLEEEVLGTLSRLRTQLGDLRARVTEFNDGSAEPLNSHKEVVVYLGQNVKEENDDSYD